jgi:hypothetical protein
MMAASIPPLCFLSGLTDAPPLLKMQNCAPSQNGFFLGSIEILVRRSFVQDERALIPINKTWPFDDLSWLRARRQFDLFKLMQTYAEIGSGSRRRD